MAQLLDQFSHVRFLFSSSFSPAGAIYATLKRRLTGLLFLVFPFLKAAVGRIYIFFRDV
jgi:hypothetical protein